MFGVVWVTLSLGGCLLHYYTYWQFSRS